MILKASHFSLARVTLILGKQRKHAPNAADQQVRQAPVNVQRRDETNCVFLMQEGIDSSPFMDDYIAHSEPIAAYLTRWSGIFPGDLDPAVSPYHITTLKVCSGRLLFIHVL